MFLICKRVEWGHHVLEVEALNVTPHTWSTIQIPTYAVSVVFLDQKETAMGFLSHHGYSQPNQ